jgi:anti-sigma factor RsiW
MSEHLSTQKVERYRLRLMSPAELLEADDHLAACETCCRMLVDPQQVRSAFSSVRTELGAVARAKPEHTSYEGLAAYVDGEIDEVDREIVKSHLEMCASCAAEARDLLAFKAALANETERAAEASPVALEAAIQAPTGWRNSITSWWRWPFNLSPLRAAGAAVIALLFLGIIAAIWLRRETAPSTPTEMAQVEPTPSLANPTPATATPTPFEPGDQQSSNANQANTLQPTPPRQMPTPRPAQRVTEPPSQTEVLALNDGAQRITLDREGNVRGLESLPPDYQRAARQALRTQSLETSPALAELGGRAGTLMGGGTSGVSFPVLSPVGKMLRSDHPVFRWGRLEGATDYSVKVYDANLRKVAASPQLSVTEWRPAQPLARGGVYIWQVTATKDGAEVISPVAPAPEARFRVLDEARAAELDQAEQKYAESHLTLGILYARAGLLEDAEREFQALVKANPHSPLARKLLRDAQAQQRR